MILLGTDILTLLRLTSLAYAANCSLSPFAAAVALSLLLSTQSVSAEVSLAGVTGEAADNVRLTLRLAKEKCGSPQWKIQHLFDDADADIDLGLRALGYYHATATKSLKVNKDCWHAQFNVNPGPRVAVSMMKVDLLGAAKFDDEFKKLLANLPLKPGNPLHHGKYEAIKSKLRSLALSRGYLKADFAEKKLIVDKASNTAQVRLTFDTGQRMVFGNISIDQDILEESFVQKYISIKPGEFYTSAELAKTHNALAQSGYFDIIDIESDTENLHKGQVPVTIRLTPKKRSRYGFGIGFDTDIGPLLNATYINRRINKYGHFFTANLDLSPVLSTAELEYFLPLSNPLTDFLTFSGGLKREDTDTFKSTSAILSTRWKHSYANGWKQTVFLDYVYEKYTAESDAGDALVLVPGASWLIAQSDNPLRPRNGYRVEAEIRGSYEMQPVSDVSFAQTYLSATWLRRFDFGGQIIARTQQGATIMDDGITNLPTSYRFYAGGLNSVRGYAYKELGPKNAAGKVEGGKFLSAFSAEYEHSIFDNWGVAAFVDTGNAYNLDNISFKTGAGLGVRWYSPVGPIRVDFAIPMNDADSDFQIHFSAGPRI